LWERNFCRELKATSIRWMVVSQVPKCQGPGAHGAMRTGAGFWIAVIGCRLRWR